MRHLSVAASVMAMNSAALGEALRTYDRAGVDLFHWDIMDGHFVPNLTFGPSVVKALRPLTDKPFDVHLMVTDPARWVAPFADAGADCLTFHAETVTDIPALAIRIREHGIKAGLAVNPDTRLETLDEEIFARLDRVLVMTVNPGFGGQQFIGQSQKLAYAVQLRSRFPQLEIMVDGGINLHTAPTVIAQGVDMLVSGSALIQSASPMAFIAALKGDTP